MGGTGTVLRATDQRLMRPVVVKLLHLAAEVDPLNVARFEREARLTSMLRSPHVVRVHDFGDEDGTPYLVMEYVPGSSLAEHGAFPVGTSCRIAAQVAEALAEAHEQGIVHRDLKPGNVLLEVRNGVPVAKVCDFGAATRQGVERTITRAGDVIGTLSYMAPEQAAGELATPQTDLYGLGLVLFELLTGERAFSASSELGVIAAHRTLAPPSLAQSGVDAPAALQALLDALLAKSPEDRPGSAAWVRDELDRLARSAGEPSPVVLPRDTSVRAALDTTAVPPRTNDRRASARRWQPGRLAPRAGAVLAAVGLLATPLVARRTNSPEPSSPVESPAEPAASEFLRRIESRTPEAGRRFGAAIALDRGRLAVGDQGTPRRVELFEFRDGAWTSVGVLDAPESRARFGASLSIDGDSLYVGAPLSSTAVPQGGVVFRYRWGDERPVERLQAVAPAAGYRFGSRVDARDGRLAVASIRQHPFANDTLDVFQCDEQACVPAAELLAPADARVRGFGHALAQDDACIWVGSVSNTLYDEGAAFQYCNDSDGWSLSERFTSTRPAVAQYFGSEVSVEGSDVVLTASGNRSFDAVGVIEQHRLAGPGWSVVGAWTPADLGLSRDVELAALVSGDWIVAAGRGDTLSWRRRDAPASSPWQTRRVSPGVQHRVDGDDGRFAVSAPDDSDTAALAGAVWLVTPAAVSTAP